MMKVIYLLSLFCFYAMKISAQGTEGRFMARLDSIVIQNRLGKGVYNSTIKYEYNELMQVNKIWKNDEHREWHFEYKPDGKLSKITLTDRGLPFLVTEYQYDEYGKVTAITDTVVSNEYPVWNPFFHKTFSYDDIGNLSTKDVYTMRLDKERCSHSHVLYKYSKKGRLKEISRWQRMLTDSLDIALSRSASRMIEIAKYDKKGKVISIENTQKGETGYVKYSRTGRWNTYDVVNGKEEISHFEQYYDEKGNPIVTNNILAGVLLHSYHTTYAIEYPVEKVAGLQEWGGEVPYQDFLSEYLAIKPVNAPLRIMISSHGGRDRCTIDYFYSDL